MHRKQKANAKQILQQATLSLHLGGGGLVTGEYESINTWVE